MNSVTLTSNTSNLNNPVETFIVNVTNSPGSLEALTEFIHQAQPNPAIAYLFTLSLSLTETDQLVQGLQRLARVPVNLVTKTVDVVGGHIYVMPANSLFQLENGTITLRSANQVDENQRSIQDLLGKLATCERDYRPMQELANSQGLQMPERGLWDKVEDIPKVSNNLQSLIGSTDIATLFLDPDLRVHLFTPATRQLFDLTPADLGRPLTDIRHRLDYSNLIPDAEQVLETLWPVEREVKTTADQTLLLQVIPYRTSDDRINGVVMTFVDVTSRKAALEALRRSEERFGAIINQATAGIAQGDIDGTLTFVNQCYCELLGYDIAEVVGNKMQQFTYPDDLAYNLEMFSQLAETGRPFAVEKRYIRKDGLVIWVHNAVSPLRNAEGVITQVLTVSVDITARKQTEADLRQSEEKYRTLFNSIDQGYCLIEVLIDEHNRPVDLLHLEANPAYQQQIGLTDIIGKRMSEMVDRAEQLWLTFYGQVALTGQPARLEYYANAFGRWFTSYASRVGGAGSRLVAVVFDDITERKRREVNQILLADLGQDFARLNSPIEISQLVGEKLFSHFELSRLTFTYVNNETGLATVVYDRHEPNLASVLGDQRVTDFVNPDYVREFGSGKPIVINNVMTDPRIAPLREAYQHFGEGALLLVPQVSKGRWRFAIALHKANPYEWRTDQIELLKDITPRLYLALERQQLEDVKRLTLLQQTEALAKVGSWEYIRQTDQLVWSNGMYKLLGIPFGTPVRPELLLDVALDEDKPKAQHMLQFIKEGEKRFETELRIRVDGQVKTLRIKAEIVGEGSQQRVLGVDLDSTDELVAQQQIQQTAQNLQAVLDGSPAAIGLLKPRLNPIAGDAVHDFRLVVGNRRLAGFFNRPLEGLLGQSAELFSGLLWDGQAFGLLQEVLLTGQASYFERQLPTDGRWVAVAITRQEDGVLVTALDISEMKAVQDQQQYWLKEVEASRQSVDALQKLQESLGQRSQQLRAVSHDLRSSISIVNGALRLMNMANTETERADMMAVVLRNVRQATKMLTGLLEYGRLEAGEQQRTIRSFDAALLLQDLSINLQSAADAEDLVLESRGPRTLMVEGDRLLVYRMAQNLTINAIKYTHEGTVTVQWGTDANRGRWWFSISDTGPGMDTELVARLNAHDNSTIRQQAFEANPESDLNEEEQGIDRARLRGEGIGLRIVQQLAQLLEAQIQVSSEKNVGTRFVVSFPIRYQ